MMDDNAKSMRSAFETSYSPDVLVRNADDTYQITSLQKEYEIFTRGWKAQAKLLFDQLNEQIAKHERAVVSMGCVVDTKNSKSWFDVYLNPILVEASVRSMRVTTVQVRTLIDRILGRPGRPKAVKGPVTWSNAVIDFGRGVRIPMYQEIPMLSFNDYTYSGVIPISCVKDKPNRFICIVANVTKG